MAGMGCLHLYFRQAVHLSLQRFKALLFIEMGMDIRLSLVSAMAATMLLTPFALAGDGPHKVTVAQYGHLLLYLPIYVACDKGFFKAEGLDVNLVSTGGDEKTFTAVSTGNAQFGVSDPTFVAIARERGQGGKVVAGIVRRFPFSFITFRNDIKPIAKPSDFAGYRIATLPAPSTSYATVTKILKNNGHQVQAKIVQGAYGSLPAMLKANQADIAMDFEPNVSTLARQGAHVLYSTTDYFGDAAVTGLMVSEDYCKQSPKEIQAAVNAIARAMKFIQQDFAGALAVARQEFPEVPEAILRDAVHRLIKEGTIPASPILTKEAWDRAIALRKEIGDLHGSGSYEDNVDMTFAKKATR
jgi:NitT/TauT family transport system substrate-binding protein